MKHKTIFKKADILVLAVILFIAAAVYFFTASDENASALIIVDGETLYELELSAVYDTYIITLENGIEIEVGNHEIRFLSSDCNGKECINCGSLSSSGDIAVCAPNKTVIKLIGENKNSPDTITY